MPWRGGGGGVGGLESISDTLTSCPGKARPSSAIIPCTSETPQAEIGMTSVRQFVRLT